MKEDDFLKYFFTLEKDLPPDVGFELYGGEHIGWIAICAAVCTICCIVYRRLSPPGRKNMRIALGCAILMCEIMKQANLIAAGAFSRFYLPLHLCGLAVFFCFYHSLAGGETVGNFLYSTCMPGALCAVLFPDWTVYPAFSYHSAVAFAVHSLIVAYPLMQVSSGGLRPRVGMLPRCLAILAGLALPVYIFDRLAGANYMFLIEPAAGSPLEWFESVLGSPGYLLGYIPMVIIIWSLLYLPFRRRCAARSELEESGKIEG